MLVPRTVTLEQQNSHHFVKLEAENKIFEELYFNLMLLASFLWTKFIANPDTDTSSQKSDIKPFLYEAKSLTKQDLNLMS